MTVYMSTCPRCGTPLLKSLVVAIEDPTQPESCPRDVPKTGLGLPYKRAALAAG